jgi:hypothetical protein
MATVDVYLLDWNKRRPFGFGEDRLTLEVLQAFQAGRYEYSFSIATPSTQLLTDHASDIANAEGAYMAQGNGRDGTKVRKDRQSMSTGDVVIVDIRAYVCASFGFKRIPQLDSMIEQRIEASWNVWTQVEPEIGPSDCQRNHYEDCDVEPCATHGASEDR